MASESQRTFTQDDIEASDEGSGVDGKAFFLGGHSYSITASEKAALESAGYTVTA